MPSVLQRAFAGGELAPALAARADLVKYQTGLRTCRNFLVQRHGGVANRAGTRFVAETKVLVPAERSRLFPYVFNDAQTYLMEFGHLYIRWYSGGAPLVVTSAPAWSSATAYVVSDLVTSDGGYYYCVLGHTNQPPPNATYWYPLTGNIYEIPTTYQSTQLDDLQIVQTASVVTIAGPNHYPRELTRTAHTTWTLKPVVFGPGIAQPDITSITGSAGSVTLTYVVTAISAYGAEESLGANEFVQPNLAAPASGSPVTIDWSAVSGASGYRIYRVIRDLKGLIGDVGSGALTWIDDGIVPDFLTQPPDGVTAFKVAIDNNDFPRVVSTYQQRLIYAATRVSHPETLFGMQTALPHNHTVSTPLVETDALTWAMRGRQINEVRHLVDLGVLLTLTSGGIWSNEGDQSGILTPFAINPRQRAYGGAATVPPVVIDSTLLYVQARKTIIRDLRYNVQSDGYAGNDLTVFAAHLFDGYQIVEMDWQQIPHSILWVVRDDGTLLGLTYLPEHQLWGWHRHDTDGVIERVCVVPEGGEDALYLLVRRTINGATKRYIERMASRLIVDHVADAWFVDSGLDYDGTNLTATTMTVSGGTNWTFDEELTVTASVAYFSAGEVGNEIRLTVGAETIRCRIATYISPTVVTVFAHQTVPTAFRNVAMTTWTRAVDQVSGLDHLEGKTVSVFADGFVEAPQVVTGGLITLSKPYGLIRAGLPITADLETLDLEIAGSPSLLGKPKLVTEVTLIVERSRGIWAGPDLTHLQEYASRATEATDEPPALVTGPVTIKLQTTWNSHGRIVVRQTDPLPLTVLGAMPTGLVSAA